MTKTKTSLGPTFSKFVNCPICKKSTFNKDIVQIKYYKNIIANCCLDCYSTYSLDDIKIIKVYGMTIFKLNKGL
ncbi:unnamed protein product [marine sediment metagenome]|uniref:Uncharacterized protein n=1 Tax=marine sediment metagenome TaxID=412755 RepID=X0X5G2_9ZZZZ